MSEAVLGFPFDIHTGGIDHREIHHPNEIAQQPGALWVRRQRRAYLDAQQLPGGPDGADEQIVGRVPDAANVGRPRLPPARLSADVPAGALPVSELEFTWEGLHAALVRLRRMVMGVERLEKRLTTSLKLDEEIRLQNEFLL